MQRRTKWIAGGVAALAVLGIGGVGIAASQGDGEEAPLTGQAREKAVAAALEYVGGGTVTETEVGDDGAAYGVEIQKADGTQVEVMLDDAFKVIGVEADDDGPNDVDADDD